MGRHASACAPIRVQGTSRSPAPLLHSAAQVYMAKNIATGEIVALKKVRMVRLLLRWHSAGMQQHPDDILVAGQREGGLPHHRNPRDQDPQEFGAQERCEAEGDRRV